MVFLTRATQCARWVLGLTWLIFAIAIGSVQPVRAAGAKCSLYPSLEEIIRVAVPPQNDGGEKGTRAIVLGIMPGAERDVREAYRFSAETALRPPEPLKIEGPLADDTLERRFRKFTPRAAETYWVLPIPLPNDKAPIFITFRHSESGRDETSGAPCWFELHRTILTIEPADPAR